MLLFKTIKTVAVFLTISSIFSCNSYQNNSNKNNDITNKKINKVKEPMKSEETTIENIVIAGGCFWCLDAVYRRMEGVTNVESGYSNGTIKNPSYKEVCTGNTGHAEVARVFYDTKKTSLEDILIVFWRIHNPTTLNKQGNDVGTQYRSGIYFENETQEKIAKLSKLAAEEAKLWDGEFTTEILPLNNYWPAEDYHQDYYTNNPDQGYCVYVVGEKVEKFKKLFSDKVKK